MKDEQVGKRFEQMVDALGIDFAKLARSIGIDRPDALYLVKNGKGYPSFETIARILEAYPQVDANFIFGRAGHPFRQENENGKKENGKEDSADRVEDSRDQVLAAFGKLLRQYQP